MSTPAETLAAPRPGTSVWLHSMTTIRLNGQHAVVVDDTLSSSRDAVARGRCAVQLQDDSIVAVRLGNLSLSPPSPHEGTSEDTRDDINEDTSEDRDIKAGRCMPMILFWDASSCLSKHLCQP